MDQISVPTDWGTDSVSRFIIDTYHNSIYTFLNLKAWEIIVEVDECFRKVCTRLENPSDFLASFFLPRSHSSYLAAVRLAVSGQLPEAYMCLRGCLESALYGFYVSGDFELAKSFLCRNDDEECRKRARTLFRPSIIIKRLAARQAKTADVARRLYEWTIEDGAHPNPRGLLSNITMQETDKAVHVTTNYLNNEPLVMGACMKCIATVGVCSLSIFELIMPEPFSACGASSTLGVLRSKL